MDKTLVLKPGREKSLLRRHPWIFSGAVARVAGSPGPGETVAVAAAGGAILGLAAYSPHSQIRARMWTFTPAGDVDAGFFRDRIETALAMRRTWGEQPEPAGLRLVHGENDGLPGLIVDRYADFVVCQFLTAGVEAWRQMIVDVLVELTGCRGVFERSDADVRAKEGLEPRTGLLAGGEPPELVEIREGDCRFLVDVRQGHKTGFYLDQRENRAEAACLAAGREVLNCFCYTGGFGIAALKGGAARVVQLDSSGPSLALAARHGELNGLDPGRLEHVEGDAFAVLREFRRQGRTFDLVVLDPPKFVEGRLHLNRAARGYKDINLQAFGLIRPGGLLLTFSCSGLLEADLFQKIVADAALDAGRQARIIGRLGQAADHPVALNFPEGTYLKGLVCAVE